MRLDERATMKCPASVEAVAGSADDPRVAEALEEYLRELEAGGTPQREEFLARHPSVAGALAPRLDGLEMMHAVSPRPGRNCEGVEPDGGVPLGDFRLIREVGRGGMGVVYEAEQLSLGRRVALKVLPFAATMDPRQLQRFHNEARAAASLHHEHIVPVFAVGSERGVHYYAMQFISGQTLAAFLRDRARSALNDQPTAPERSPHPAAQTAIAATTDAPPRGDAAYFRRVAEWGAAAAEALEHAHSLGVVHRDVKPGNLLVDDRGKLWVTDFGLARTQADAGLTAPGDVLGTLRYMSPEQALAQHGLVDHRTDVYSLGATLYELLTGVPAIDGVDRREILHKIAGVEPRPLGALNRSVPRDLETVVLKAMAKDPSDRYATARELAEDLARVVEDQPVRARRPSLTARLRSWGRRHPSATWSALVGVIVAAAVLSGSVGWVLSGEAARRRETEQIARHGLDEIVALQEQGRWQEAASAAERVTTLLAGRDAGQLGERVRLLLADSQMMVWVEEIRLRGAEIKDRDSLLSDEGTDGDYAEAFRRFGLEVDGLPAEEAGRLLRERSVGPAFASVLDHWAWIRKRSHKGSVSSWKHLLAVAQTADPDQERNRVRAAVGAGDENSLKELAETARFERMQASTVALLAWALVEIGSVDVAVDLLRQGQRRHPEDLWLNYALAVAIPDPSARGQRAGFLRAAVALRPRHSGLRSALGGELRASGALDEAIAEFCEAIRFKGDDAWAHYHLASALEAKGALDEAIAEYRVTLSINKDHAGAQQKLLNLVPVKPEDVRPNRQPVAEDRRRVWTYSIDGGGRFERGEGQSWVQVRNSGPPSFYLREVARTDGYVELYDEARNLPIRLYNKVLYQNPRREGWGIGFEGSWQ